MTDHNTPIPDAIGAALSTRTATRLHEQLIRLELFEGGHPFRNADNEALRYALNEAFEQAWNKLVREPFVNAGKWETLPAGAYALQEGMHPAVHVVESYLKRTLKAPASVGPIATAMLLVLSWAAPIAARVKALTITKRTPGANKSPAQIADDAKRMTCQICGARILAETGLVAHHGYRRPGDGFQTSSCPGAKELPKEVSRAKLGRFIIQLQDNLVTAELHRDRVDAGEAQVPWVYLDQKKVAQLPRYADKSSAQTRAMVMDQDELDQARGEALANGTWSPTGALTFARLRHDYLSRLDAQLRNLRREHAHHQVMFAGWVRTHRAGVKAAGEDVWVKL